MIITSLAKPYYKRTRRFNIYVCQNFRELKPEGQMVYVEHKK